MYPFTSIQLNQRSVSIDSILNQRIAPKNDFERSTLTFISDWLSGKESFAFQTSGSTGSPKLFTFTRQQMQQSAARTIKALTVKSGDEALVCLNTHYIAGKMMLVRAMVAGWDLYTTSPEKNPLINFDENFDFAAMVPYQVFHSLADLHKVKKVIVGGGAVSSELEQRLQKVNSKVFAT